VLTRPSIRAVLIDLDGTLLDTVHDLADAANGMRARLDLEPLDTALLRSFIGNGIGELVKRALAGRHDAPAPALDRFETALAIYEEEYAAVLTRSPALFPGVREGLDAMRSAGLHLACVTNKAARFTLPLLQHTGLAGDFELVLSGDSLPRKKPDPMPLLHACEVFGTLPAQTALIGDSENDAEAAHAAGCPLFLVPYGYRRTADLSTLGPARIAASLAEAAAMLDNAGTAS